MCCHFVILPKGTLAMQIAGHPEALKKKKGRILPIISSFCVKNTQVIL